MNSDLQAPTLPPLAPRLAEAFAALKSAASKAAEELFARAKELANDHEKISASFLQRKLRIGSPRAKELMDQLRDAGVIDDDEE